MKWTLSPDDWSGLGRIIFGIFVSLMAFVGQYLREIVARHRKHEDQPSIESTHQQDIRIQQELAATGTAVGAMRVFLAKFHNGDHYADGSEIQKVSHTHEWARDAYSHSEPYFRQMMMSEIPDELELVIETGPSWKLVSKLPQGRFQTIERMLGSQAVSRVAVKVGKRSVGFVGADFCSPDPDKQDPAEPANMFLLLRCAERMGEILSER